MAHIYETSDFLIDTQDKPFVDRADGGHVRIMSKIKVSDRPININNLFELASFGRLI